MARRLFRMAGGSLVAPSNRDVDASPGRGLGHSHHMLSMVRRSREDHEPDPSARGGRTLRHIHLYEGQERMARSSRIVSDPWLANWATSQSSGRMPSCAQLQVNRQFNRAALPCDANLVLSARKRDLERLALKISQAELHVTRDLSGRTWERRECILVEFAAVDFDGHVPVPNKRCESMRVRYYLSLQVLMGGLPAHIQSPCDFRRGGLALAPQSITDLSKRCCDRCAELRGCLWSWHSSWVRSRGGIARFGDDPRHSQLRGSRQDLEEPDTSVGLFRWSSLPNWAGLRGRANRLARCRACIRVIALLYTTRLSVRY